MLRLGLLAISFSVLAAASTVVTFNPAQIGQPASAPVNQAVTNEWAAFGITADGLYWYQDSRDTFDTYGLSVNSPNGGSILFATPTALTIDYFVIGGFTGTYRVYDVANNLLETFDVVAGVPDVLGTYAFAGTNIARLTLTGATGFVQVSTLNFDSSVPEPASYLLLGVGLGALAFLRRRA